MKILYLRNMIVLLFIFFIALNCFAQESEHKQDHFHYNHFAVFVGASSLFEREETQFTFGADYVRYFSPESNFAMGIYTEAIFAHHTEWLFGAVLFYGLTEHLWIRSGPGIEILQEEIAHTGETESKTEFLYRVGVGYSFHFGRISIAPSVDLDFVRSSPTLVWGVNIGMGI